MPHDETLLDLVRKHCRSGVLLDSNILLLYVIGRFDSTRIEKFKRTSAFKKGDFEILTDFLLPFDRIIATPHTLTEVSNLAGALIEPAKTECFELFAADIHNFDERFTTAMEIVAVEGFARFGVADTAISTVGQDGCLVLTDDLNLYGELMRNGVDAINFNHIRVAGWQN